MVCSVARLYWQCSVGAMTAYCSLATSPLAVCAHEVVGRQVRPGGDVVPGHQPEPGDVDLHPSRSTARPCNQDGSFGVRSIMRRRSAPASRRHRCPSGRPRPSRMSFSGRCASALAQSTGGICGARSNIFDAVDQLLLRSVAREHRAAPGSARHRARRQRASAPRRRETSCPARSTARPGRRLRRSSPG